MKLSGRRLFENRFSLALPNFGDGFFRMPACSGFFRDDALDWRSRDGERSVELLREFSRDILGERIFTI